MKLSHLLSTSAMLVTMAVSGIAYAADSGSNDHPGAQKWRAHREEVLSQLPADKAQLFKDTMKQSREKDKAVHDQIRKVFKERDAILTADKFDKKAYLAKSAEITKLFTQVHDNMTNSFVSVAEKFTPEERKILAKLRPEKPMRGMKDDGPEKDDADSK